MTLVVLAAGYTGSNALGFVGARIAREARLEPTGLVSVLHLTGLALSVVLLLVCISELVDRRPAIRRHPTHSRA